MSMTLDEAILHAEEVATEQERLMGRYDAASGYARSGNESIRTKSAKECEQCAAEHRQLAAWLRELAERRKEQYLTIEQIATAVGMQTIHSAYLWFDFARTLEILGYAVVKRRTDADD